MCFPSLNSIQPLNVINILRWKRGTENPVLEKINLKGTSMNTSGSYPMIYGEVISKQL